MLFLKKRYNFKFMSFKRLFDLFFASIALILLAPLFAGISLAILISMGFPVFYKQTRIGYMARPFILYKFRSMKINTLNVSITLSNDNRLTQLGVFMRKWKIDEVPQLINIIKGDMSIVGPRPDVPGYSDKLTGEDRIIWSVKPGLTGLDSITYINEALQLDNQNDPQDYYDRVLWPAKVKLNIIYVKNKNMILDFVIIIYTLLRRNPDTFLKRFFTNQGLKKNQ